MIDPVALPPEWLLSVMVFINQIPYVGPVLLEAAKWSGVIVVVLTSVSAFLLALSKSLDQVKPVPKLGAVAEKVKQVVDKVMPYVMYLSAFNVQKKPKNLEGPQK